ncbi:hypothetical protein roselon_01094 [Roseibacterium elongatum DSM 19469]|uniref:Uncharacterized protein n=1 Tax=Roseicyclus elongatus DSM 19469 TaxID=1294273 RepID=W8S3Y9_9RHOB|nr:hypothetical protein roselon_01094 [Roseibacterium elongatum DSM 19469]
MGKAAKVAVNHAAPSDDVRRSKRLPGCCPGYPLSIIGHVGFNVLASDPPLGAVSRMGGSRRDIHPKCLSSSAICQRKLTQPHSMGVETPDLLRQIKVKARKTSVFWFMMQAFAASKTTQEKCKF